MSVHFLPILWYRVVIHLMVFQNRWCMNKKITPNFNGLGVCLVAGAGFEPTTFRLWAWRATGLLHPAINWCWSIMLFILICQAKNHYFFKKITKLLSQTQIPPQLLCAKFSYLPPSFDINISEWNTRFGTYFSRKQNTYL